ncbi:Outer membrane protein TolC [Chitinophaga sp. YR627]|uniref:TolC family protein n=1 Tax=Chitinophaga sp. YR627 TaxID=1881041 RepID=UPI0008E45D89|nr:TolC family protein [Chitinophaga sp. YR627]SFN19173.1 Outer membrane protein TolC [Chitinophaga sp. YR627]
MNKRLLLATLALLPSGLFAQSVWTLRSCIEYGMKNNRNNVIYDNEKKAADAQAKEALAAYLPSVSLNGSLDDNLKVQETVIPAGIFGPDDIRVAFTKKFNSNGSAQLDQTIFDQSLIVGLKANKYNVQQATLNQKKSEETIIYNITNAYYQIFIYREQLGMLKSNQEKYRQQMNVTAQRVNKGTVLQKELDKVTVDYNNAVSQIVVAESNITLSENQLKYEMGYPIKDPIQVDSSAAEGNLRVVAPVLAEDKNFSAYNRTDYQLSQVNASLLDIDQRRIKAGIYPRLTAYARYGAVGFGDKLNQSFSTMSTYSAIGLKLSFPLLDFFKRNAQYNQAKYKHLNAVEKLKLDEGKYELEYENARTKMMKEQSNVENNRRNIDLAQSVFDVTNLQYEKGTTDMTDWINAQNSVKEAQNNYLSSLYNLILARLELEKTAGTLKTFYTAL